MKKFTSGLLVSVITISLMSYPVLANGVISNDKIINFQITSGLDTEKMKSETEKDKTDIENNQMDSKEIPKESTFDEKRTITGTADKGTTVTIQVYTTDEKLKKEKEVEEKKIKDYTEEDLGVTDEIIVGASGIFSKIIDLEIGENIIIIIISKENHTTIEKQFVINRKKREIKQDLEKTIVLPGDKNVITPSKILEKS